MKFLFPFILFGFLNLKAQCDSLKFIINYQQGQILTLNEKLTDYEMQLVKINLVEDEVSKVAANMKKYNVIIDSLKQMNDTLILDILKQQDYIRYLEFYLSSKKKRQMAKDDFEKYLKEKEGAILKEDEETEDEKEK